MRTWEQIPKGERWHYDNCPECDGPKSKTAAFCRACSPLMRGANHPAWKGDKALPSTKRLRAQAAYTLGDCERCGAKATDRHHRDGDTGNNVPENIARLCRRCHMVVDGRMKTRHEDGRFASIHGRYHVKFRRAA